MFYLNYPPGDPYLVFKIVNGQVLPLSGRQPSGLEVPVSRGFRRCVYLPTSSRWTLSSPSATRFLPGLHSFALSWRFDAPSGRCLGLSVRDHSTPLRVVPHTRTDERKPSSDGVPVHDYSHSANLYPLRTQVVSRVSLDGTEVVGESSTTWSNSMIGEV